MSYICCFRCLRVKINRIGIETCRFSAHIGYHRIDAIASMNYIIFTEWNWSYAAVHRSQPAYSSLVSVCSLRKWDFHGCWAGGNSFPWCVLIYQGPLLQSGNKRGWHTHQSFRFAVFWNLANWALETLVRHSLNSPDEIIVIQATGKSPAQISTRYNRGSDVECKCKSVVG